MPPRYTGPLKAAEATNLIKTTTKNAMALIEDAKLLFENGRHARAIYLAIVALEEIGKIFLTVTFYARPIPDWNEFWRRFYRHPR